MKGDPVKHLVYASVVVATMSWIVAVLHDNAGYSVGGVAMGLWLSALYLWLRD